MKMNQFNNEISLISNTRIRKFTEIIIDTLPSYFFEVPASSTGKYHPDYALGNGGLVRHVKAAFGIAYDLFKINKFTEIEMDCIMSALILHDGVKHGLTFNQYVRHEHPLLMFDYVLRISFECDYKREIAELIKTHMGQFTTCKWSKIVLPEPKSKCQRFVHMCDYLASRKTLEYNFNV